MATATRNQRAGLKGEHVKGMPEGIEKEMQRISEMQPYIGELRKGVEMIGAIAEKLESMNLGDEEFKKLIDSIDHSDILNANGDPNTEEGITLIMNRLIFKGNWEEHVKWAERHGTEEDADVVKRVMKG